MNDPVFRKIVSGTCPTHGEMDSVQLISEDGHGGFDAVSWFACGCVSVREQSNQKLNDAFNHKVFEFGRTT